MTQVTVPTINAGVAKRAEVIAALNAIADVINGDLDSTNFNGSAPVPTDSVTDTQLDYPRWWQEIGRTTLAVAGDTITVSSIPARKYLKIIVRLFDTGGTIGATLRFNNDSGANYAHRFSQDGADDPAVSVSQTSNFLDPTGATAAPIFAELEVMNFATAEKLSHGVSVSRGTAGAAAIGNRREYFQKWANTSDQITRVDVVNSGTGDYAIGSEVVILGHD